MKILADEALVAMRAQPIGTLPKYLSYSIDTRSLQPGQTYLALTGPNFDGHRFLEQARQGGAVAAIVADATALPAEMPGYVVEDTHAALLHLAQAARGHFCGAVIAITGSTGKTTTKAFLAHILQQARMGAIAATPQNENNEIGVSKVLLGLESEAAVVIEMGARHPDDIAPLVAIARPHVSILTNIGDAHVGIFGSHDELARTKWQIFSGDARAILSLHDGVSRARFSSLAQEPLFCGFIGDAPLHAVPQLLLDGCELILRFPNRAETRASLTALPPGEHNVRNLLSACAAAIAIGVPLDIVARGASDVVMPHGRYERIPTAVGATIIHDAYNASPSGTLATLKAFAQEPGRRIVVLGSMAELGADAADAHRRVGAALAEVDAEKIILLGEFAHELEAGALLAGVQNSTLAHVPNTTTAVQILREMLQSGDVVVVKGSRMYRLEQIIDALTSSVEAA